MSKRPPPKRRTPFQRARLALGELERALDEIAAAEGLPRPRDLEIKIRLGRKAEGAEDALKALRSAVHALAPMANAWRAGTVHCYLCEAPCNHATPPTPDHVFSGYQPSGKPTWRPFVEICIARREPGMDQLYETPPGVVAYADGAELSEDLVASFAEVPWRVLGQVVVGLVFETRTAVCAQIVQISRPGAPVNLRLNLIGLDLVEVQDQAARGEARGVAERLRRTVQQLRRKLGGIERKLVAAQARGDSFDLAGAVTSLLGRLRGDLSRIFTPESRRTEHAKERHLSGERPTSQAFRDARGAGDERLFRDTRRGTVVVIGSRGRAHVFNNDGRHVTSLRLDEGELKRKQARRRWTLLRPEEAAAFRDALG